MTYHDEWLKHHGVKGMKWGVRSYKKIRKEAKPHLKKMDKTRDAKEMSEAASNRAKSKRDAADNRLAIAKHNQSVNGSRGNNRKVDKLSKKLSKQEESYKDAEKSRKESSKEFLAAEKSYNKRVSEAASLPVTIKRREMWAEAKRSGKNIGASIGQSILDGQLEKMGAGPAKGMFETKGNRTGNDRFAESVQKRQYDNHKTRRD